MTYTSLVTLLQKYIGMQPRDVGCANYKEVEKELAYRILKSFSHWQPYDFYKIETRPTEAGKKYFVMRKDGKVHWETWNGSGFAYNNNVITHYMEIKLPTE